MTHAARQKSAWKSQKRATNQASHNTQVAILTAIYHVSCTLPIARPFDRGGDTLRAPPGAGTVRTPWLSSSKSSISSSSGSSGKSASAVRSQSPTLLRSRVEESAWLSEIWLLLGELRGECFLGEHFLGDVFLPVASTAEVLSGNCRSLLEFP